MQKSWIYPFLIKINEWLFRHLYCYDMDFNIIGGLWLLWVSVRVQQLTIMITMSSGSSPTIDYYCYYELRFESGIWL